MNWKPCPTRRDILCPSYHPPFARQGPIPGSGAAPPAFGASPAGKCSGARQRVGRCGCRAPGFLGLPHRTKFPPEGFCWQHTEIRSFLRPDTSLFAGATGVSGQPGPAGHHKCFNMLKIGLFMALSRQSLQSLRDPPGAWPGSSSQNRQHIETRFFYGAIASIFAKPASTPGQLGPALPHNSGKRLKLGFFIGISRPS